jgi:hypothetical protein
MNVNPVAGSSKKLPVNKKWFQNFNFGKQKSTATRKAGGLNLSAIFWRTKAKALQCFYVELATGCKAPGLLARINRDS